MICGAISNELTKTTKFLAGTTLDINEQIWADLGHEIKYEDQLRSIRRFGCDSHLAPPSRYREGGSSEGGGEVEQETWLIKQPE